MVQEFSFTTDESQIMEILLRLCLDHRLVQFLVEALQIAKSERM